MLRRTRGAGRRRRSLRGLHRAQTRAVRGTDHCAHDVDFLDGVDDRENRNDGGASGSYLGHDAGDQRRWGECPGCIVDEHDGCVADSGETGAYRIGPLEPSGHDGDVVTDMTAGRVEQLGRHDDDDAIDGTRGPETVDGPCQKRVGTQTDECLRLVVSEPKAFACCGYQATTSPAVPFTPSSCSL